MPVDLTGRPRSAGLRTRWHARRLDVGCMPCAVAAPLSVLVSVGLVGSAAHDVPSAMLALGVAAFGLRQRLTNASSCAA